MAVPLNIGISSETTLSTTGNLIRLARIVPPRIVSAGTGIPVIAGSVENCCRLLLYPRYHLLFFPYEGSYPFGAVTGSLVIDTANSRNYNWSVIFCTFEAYAVATAGIRSLHGRWKAVFGVLPQHQEVRIVDENLKITQPNNRGTPTGSCGVHAEQRGRPLVACCEKVHRCEAIE